MVGLGVCGASGDERPLEYQVKAAFLLNFARFVEWPPGTFANDDAPISICVLGEDPFGQVLDSTLHGEFVDAHRFAVRRFLHIPPAGYCHVVFVGSGEKDVAGILAGLGRGVLTVGEGDQFLRASGMIALVIDNRRVRFDVNQAAADRAGVKLSAKLLSVARSVER
jgi:hypothetical protein